MIRTADDELTSEGRFDIFLSFTSGAPGVAGRAGHGLSSKEAAMPAKVDKDKCTGCGNCIEACPCEAIKLDEIAKISEKDCTECGVCVDECPCEAIVIEA